MLYDDWFLVKWTLSCEVDTETRINVYVKWSDGDKPWIPWCRGIIETTAFKTFYRLNRELQYLLISMPAESRSIHENNKLETTPIEPSDEVYINIRLHGYQWYELLNLPKLVFTGYIAILICGDWCNDTLGNHPYDWHLYSSCSILHKALPRINYNFVLIPNCPIKLHWIEFNISF